MKVILERFEKVFDEAQSNIHDIECATNQAIEYYYEKYPHLINEFENIIQEKIRHYLEN
jgi:hypothetical protein